MAQCDFSLCFIVIGTALFFVGKLSLQPDQFFLIPDVCLRILINLAVRCNAKAFDSDINSDCLICMRQIFLFCFDQYGDEEFSSWRLGDRCTFDFPGKASMKPCFHALQIRQFDLALLETDFDVVAGNICGIRLSAVMLPFKPGISGMSFEEFLIGGIHVVNRIRQSKLIYLPQPWVLILHDVIAITVAVDSAD